jgi:hypothetical protein
MFDAIEMGTNLCSQNRLGLVLLDNILIKIGLKLLRL